MNLKAAVEAFTRGSQQVDAYSPSAPNPVPSPVSIFDGRGATYTPATAPAAVAQANQIETATLQDKVDRLIRENERMRAQKAQGRGGPRLMLDQLTLLLRITLRIISLNETSTGVLAFRSRAKG